MKCIRCGRKTAKGKIVCENCISLDNYLHFFRIHECASFQEEGEKKGVCQHVLSCEPIKKALQGEALVVKFQGHIVCPHPKENLLHVIYGKFNEEELKNYSECLE